MPQVIAILIMEERRKLIEYDPPRMTREQKLKADERQIQDDPEWLNKI